jgi:hypothetical protein
MAPETYPLPLNNFKARLRSALNRTMAGYWPALPVWITPVVALNNSPYLIRSDVADFPLSSVGPGDLDVATPLATQTEMDYSAASAVYAAASVYSSVLLVVPSGQGNLGPDRIQIRAMASDESKIDPVISRSLVFEELRLPAAWKIRLKDILQENIHVAILIEIRDGETSTVEIVSIRAEIGHARGKGQIVE